VELQEFFMNNVFDCWYGLSVAWIVCVMKLKAKIIRRNFEEKASIFFSFLILRYISIGVVEENGKEGTLYIGLKKSNLLGFLINFLWYEEFLISHIHVLRK